MCLPLNGQVLVTERNKESKEGSNRLYSKAIKIESLREVQAYLPNLDHLDGSSPRLWNSDFHSQQSSPWVAIWEERNRFLGGSRRCWSSGRKATAAPSEAHILPVNDIQSQLIFGSYSKCFTCTMHWPATRLTAARSWRCSPLLTLKSTNDSSMARRGRL